jgi:hypothetical protein
MKAAYRCIHFASASPGACSAPRIVAMEEVCDRENLVKAWKRVRRNQGSPGVDGKTIDDTKDYLREHLPSIRSQLLEGTYQPQPVKRVEFPRRGQKARRALRRRQTDPTSRAVGSPGAVGPDVFQAGLCAGVDFVTEDGRDEVGALREVAVNGADAINAVLE